ncbi:MAG: precorrin-2 dehydrogenase/sirohydrochlorin ferrochelatase family protein [Stellaceae bacterium]
MLPMTLDLSRLRLALIGAGPAASQRLERLDAAGALALTVYAPAASIALSTLAGPRLVPRLPRAEDFAGIQIAFIAGLAPAAAAAVTTQARAAGTIVHVEDAPEQSDAQMPAALHRGDLTIAISTAGRSPGLAAEIKRALGHIIGAEWSARLNEISVQRNRWRAAGLDSAEVRQWTADWLTACGWLAFDSDSESHCQSGAAHGLAGRRIRQHRDESPRRQPCR